MDGDLGAGKMREGRANRKRRGEAGIALLIAIFILLLIGVVAIALVVSSGTEAALAGNYRSSTTVYYGSVAGLEEVRARLRPSNPNSFNSLNSGTFLPPPGTPLAICSPVYLLNPAQGEVVTPWDPANPYYDQQYGQEFGGVCGTTLPPNPSRNTTSVWQSNPLKGLPSPPPLYKWVRISAITEQSLNLDTCPYDTTTDPALVYYGIVAGCSPTGFSLNDTATGAQVLELTAFAALPNGTQKLLQYLVAPAALNLTFSAALTLDGNNVQFTVPNTTNFQVSGTDQGSVGNCNPGAVAVTAVGYTNASDPSRTNILSAIQANRTANYSPTPPPPPANVNLVSLSSLPGCPGCSLTTAGGLNALVQAITQSADVVIQGPATQASMPTAMSATNPMTIVVNGNLTFNGWHSTGYGLLVVTGDFSFDPDASWDGIVLVIGTGKLYSQQNGNGQFLGAVLLARTLDASGNVLPAGSSPVSSYFDFTPSSGSNGIFYSSCWVQAAQPAASYKVLSFREISQ
jgi:hypothetical protein